MDPHEQPPAIDPATAEAAYAAHLPHALALDPEAILPMRADPYVALHNTQAGTAAVAVLEAALKPDLPRIDWARLKELPQVALAVVFAAGQVDRHVPSSGETARKRTRCAELRSLLLVSAQALAKAGLLPGHEVDRIRSGSGAIDSAQDCIDLAALFQTHAAQVAGRTPFTEAERAEAATLGTDLVRTLKPAAVRPVAGQPTPADHAAEMRDRLWTLLVLGYRDVLRVAYWQWLGEADLHVPALQSARKPKVVSEPAA